MDIDIENGWRGGTASLCVQSYFPFFTIFDLWQDEDHGGGFSFGSLYCKLDPREAARMESGRLNAKKLLGPYARLVFSTFGYQPA